MLKCLGSSNADARRMLHKTGFSFLEIVGFGYKDVCLCVCVCGFTLITRFDGVIMNAIYTLQSSRELIFFTMKFKMLINLK